MELYTDKTANNIISLIECYIDGLIDYKEFTKEIKPLINYDDFCIKQQGRIDKGLCSTEVTKELIRAMETFLKDDSTRFSGMDIEKGYYNDLDYVHLCLDRWIAAYFKYYPKGIEITFEISKKSEGESRKSIHTIEQPQPDIMETPRAKKYFDEAINRGLIEQTETGYKRKISKALLAYFLELVFCRNDEGKPSGAAFPEKALNTLFNETRLSKSKTQNKDTKGKSDEDREKPIGHERVDALFK